MKAKTTISLLTVLVNLLLASAILAQSPTFEWAKKIGGSHFDYGRSIAIDPMGNVYVTGDFSETVDFDPGPGTASFSAIDGEKSDAYVLKLDANGNFIWAKQIGGILYSEGFSITTDVSGNVYTTGNFWETVDFDPGAGTYNLTSVDRYDIFIQKLDANGNFLWAKRMGGADSQFGYSISTDANGNVYTTGRFESGVDFDPGTGTTNLASAGFWDIFIQKLDTNGEFVWAKRMGGVSSDYGYSITTDINGIYTTGFFRETVDFDPGVGITNLTAAGWQSIFIQKLNTNGDFIWARQMGGPNNAWGRSIITDVGGNVYTTGEFTGTADFDPGPGTTNLTSGGGTDIFVQKLDVNGNLLWVKHMRGLEDGWGSSISTDANGNVYITGEFRGTFDFNPGAGITNLTPSGSQAYFIQKLDTNGNLLWVQQMGGPDYVWGRSIAIDANSNVYTTGDFEGTVDFDPGTGTTNLTSAGWKDIFVQKLSMPTAGLIENSFSEYFVVYPNPTDGQFSIEFKNTKELLTVKLLSISGQVIKTERFQNTNTIKFELNQPNGLYLLEISDSQKNKAILKIIKD